MRRLGFLQMDPIATVATPQRLVLYSRLGPFDAGELERLIWEERKLIEYDAFIYPVEDMPLLRARMRGRGRGRSPGQRKWIRDFLHENASLRRYILREFERNGPMLARDLKVEVPADADRHAWWGRGQLRLMLEVLAGRGQVAVAGRVGTHRLWDLGERVFPPSETLPIREAEYELEQRRRRSLGVWKERGTWHVHPDIPDDPVPNRVTFLSPFDRLVHDRDRAEYLWGFYYRLEMYVPKDKREYGYYVLPILKGDRIVGRIEPVLDRKASELRINGVWWEDGVKPVALQPALKSLARWLGATPVQS
ncbi:MAG: DNA glycosylase AlkZ-like family protein [Gaiellaceae bacterium]